MAKKVVVIHPSGMHQIIGHAPDTYPVTLPLDGVPMALLGREVPFVSLVKVNERAAFYKEPMTTERNYTFHEHQI